MKNNKIYIIVAASILVVGFLLFTLEKLQVTNFYEKPIPVTVDTPRPVNSVDYTPQTSPPDPTVNSEKNPGSTSDTQSSQPSSIAVSIARANQDASSKNLNIGIFIDGTKSGTCTLSLIQDNSNVLTKTAAVVEQSGLATCAGFTVLASEIPSSGTYTVKVSVANSSASKTLELAK